MLRRAALQRLVPRRQLCHSHHSRSWAVLLLPLLVLLPPLPLLLLPPLLHLPLCVRFLELCCHWQLQVQCVIHPQDVPPGVPPLWEVANLLQKGVAGMAEQVGIVATSQSLAARHKHIQAVGDRQNTQNTPRPGPAEQRMLNADEAGHAFASSHPAHCFSKAAPPLFLLFSPAAP